MVLDPTSVPDFTFSNGRMRFKGKLVVGSSLELKTKLLTEFHYSPVGGHLSRRGTSERLNTFFYWPNMRANVVTYVRECEVCQLNMHETRPL